MKIVKGLNPENNKQARVFFNYLTMQDAGENRHASLVMQELGDKLGFKVIGAVPQTLFDGWDYWIEFDIAPEFPDTVFLGVELQSGTPWVHCISSTDISAIRIALDVAALYKANTINGGVSGHEIDYQIELATDGGAYSVVLADSFTGKTTTPFRRSVRIDLPHATTGSTVRVTRMTPNAHSVAIADTMNIVSYTEMIDARLDGLVDYPWKPVGQI